MTRTFLIAKIHRATVTGAELNYEGSIAVDSVLIDAAGLFPMERVEIYNIATGARFATYLIAGKSGEVTLNGAAARLVQPGDRIIVCAYGQLTPDEIETHTARVVLVDDRNQITRVFGSPTGG
jgi:aspartate 1-decarboxylase